MWPDLVVNLWVRVLRASLLPILPLLCLSLWLLALFNYTRKRKNANAYKKKWMKSRSFLLLTLIVVAGGAQFALGTHNLSCGQMFYYQLVRRAVSVCLCVSVSVCRNNIHQESALKRCPRYRYEPQAFNWIWVENKSKVNRNQTPLKERLVQALLPSGACRQP